MSDYTDSGVLFRNHDKKDDRHPDYKGELSICCASFPRPLAAWFKVAKNGAKYLVFVLQAEEIPH